MKVHRRGESPWDWEKSPLLDACAAVFSEEHSDDPLPEGEEERIRRRVHAALDPAVRSRQRVRLSRFAAPVAACVLIAAAGITTYAVSPTVQHTVQSAVTTVVEAVKAVFTKEELLVDPYAETIDAAGASDTVTVTVEKLVRDWEKSLLYVRLHRDTPFAGDILACASLSVTDADGAVLYRRVTTDFTKAALAGDVLCALTEGQRDVELRLPVSFPSGGTYTLAIEGLCTITDETTPGEPDNLRLAVSAPYCDRVEVAFDLTALPEEGLPVTRLCENLPFTVDGSDYTLVRCEMTPLSMEILLADTSTDVNEPDTVTYNGYTFRTLERFHHFHEPWLYPEEMRETYPDTKSRREAYLHTDEGQAARLSMRDHSAELLCETADGTLHYAHSSITYVYEDAEYTGGAALRIRTTFDEPYSPEEIRRILVRCGETDTTLWENTSPAPDAGSRRYTNDCASPVHRRK